MSLFTRAAGTFTIVSIVFGISILLWICIFLPCAAYLFVLWLFQKQHRKHFVPMDKSPAI